MKPSLTETEIIVQSIWMQAEGLRFFSTPSMGNMLLNRSGASIPTGQPDFVFRPSSVSNGLSKLSKQAAGFGLSASHVYFIFTFHEISVAHYILQKFEAAILQIGPKRCCLLEILEIIIFRSALHDFWPFKKKHVRQVGRWYSAKRFLVDGVVE